MLDALSFTLSGDGSFYAVEAASADIKGTVSVPESYRGLPVARIDDGAFSHCPNLTRLSLPKSLNFISLEAFDGSPSLALIDVDAANPNYASQEGVLYNAERTALLVCPEGKSGPVIVPSSVLSIEAYAFEGCAKIANVSLPASLTSMGESAFDGCVSLSSIDVDVNNVIFSSLDGILFNKARTALLRYPLARRGDYAIPAGVTAIEGSAFESCQALASLVLPEGVRTIGDFAFSRCATLASINIPDGVVSLGEAAFSRCPSLTTLYLPASLTTIGEDAFYLATGLEAIDVSWSNPSYSSQDGVVFDKERSTVLICPCGKKGEYAVPFGVTSIDERAFWHCAALEAIFLPRTMVRIEVTAFAECSSLVRVEVEEGNPKYASVDGCLLDAAGEGFLLCPNGKQGDFTVPSGVAWLGDNCFDGCAKLTSIALPDGLLSIGVDAFYGCVKLVGLTLPETLNDIGERAFYRCEALASIAFPKALSVIGSMAFAKCFALADVSYLGKVREWQGVEKGSLWQGDMPATKVRCLDGDAPVED